MWGAPASYLGEGTCKLERLGSLRLSKYSASEVSCALGIGQRHAWKSTITWSSAPHKTYISAPRAELSPLHSIMALRCGNVREA